MGHGLDLVKAFGKKILSDFKSSESDVGARSERVGMLAYGDWPTSALTSAEISQLGLLTGSAA